ncbi:hypothetical protein A9Q84_10410 [Halobacteriovorax marinus]|uniref:HTH merR-type domain-containing protein n=1 Tax=Halobacteriovorax marinus TaxID=97084 RepID=A0A1Y5F7J1_9BACT|nr:hypothetical protein A9Q84_10410 [Halobacteriovorax marinus]
MYNIQLASSLSGINVHNLRAWERRYSAVTPDRDSVGRRLYSKDHIQKLFLLNQLVKEGTAIRHIAEKSRTELLSLVEEKGLESDLNFDQKPNEEEEIHLSFNAMTMALNFKKFDIVTHELNKAISKYDLRRVVFELLIPFLGVMRKKLNTKELTLSEKQSLITLIKFYLRRSIYQGNTGISSQSVIIAAPAGDSYELQVLIASLLMSHYGKEVIYLGANVEARSILDTSEATGAKNILIWASCLWSEKKSVELSEYFKELCENSKEGTNLAFACNGGASYEFSLKDHSVNLIKDFKDFDTSLKDQDLF